MSFFSQAFRSIISLSFRRLESYLHFGIQSHCLAQRSDTHFQFGIQSRRSESGIQGHQSAWHSKPSYFQFSIQSHWSTWHSDATIFLQFGIQRHQSVWHLEPPFSFSSTFRATFLAFRVVILFQFDVQSHIASIQSYRFLLVQHSGSFSSLQMFRALSSQLRVVLFICDLESFFTFRALSSQPRVVYFIYDPESFFLLKPWAYDPESFFLFMTQSHSFHLEP